MAGCDKSWCCVLNALGHSRLKQLHCKGPDRVCCGIRNKAMCARGMVEYEQAKGGPGAGVRVI